MLWTKERMYKNSELWTYVLFTICTEDLSLTNLFEEPWVTHSEALKQIGRSTFVFFFFYEYIWGDGIPEFQNDRYCIQTCFFISLVSRIQKTMLQCWRPRLFRLKHWEPTVEMNFEFYWWNTSDEGNRPCAQ